MTKNDVSSRLHQQPVDKLSTDSVIESRGKYQVGVRWFMLSGAIALLGIVGWFGYQRLLQTVQKPIAVSFIPVKRGAVELTISESGTVALQGEQTLKSPEDSTVEQVFVQAGDRVQSGVPLLLLRNRADQQRQTDQILENQKLRLERLRKQEIVREQLATLNESKQRLKDSEDLLKQHVLTKIRVQDDYDKVSNARSAVRNAELEQRKAELEVQKGQAALQDIQQRLGDNRLTSPMNALILRVEVKPGDGAKRETTLLTLGDPSRETVNLQLNTLNAAKVRINQVARISMIGPKPKTFVGRVISLSPQAASQKTERTFGSQPQAKVDAAVALDRPSHVLIPGSQVSVEIVLSQQQNVLTLPLEAVQQMEDNPFVWIKNRAGQAEKRSVKVGLQSLTLVEVQSGLQVGETVVLPPPTQVLTPGTVVQASPNPTDSSAAAP